jgi:hypothetical protein
MPENLDFYFELYDKSEITRNQSAIEHNRFGIHYKPELFPEGAYFAISQYQHFRSNHNPEMAEIYAKIFEAMMGFSFQELEERSHLLQDIANNKISKI